MSSPAPSLPVRISDQPCYEQVVAWNGTPLLKHINQDLRNIHEDAVDWTQGMGPRSDVQRGWTALAGDALTGLKNPPPTCLLGTRKAWMTGMTDYLAAAGSFSKADSQDNSLIIYQIQGAQEALRQFTALVSSITG
jgi:hypothetical protein